MSTISAGLTSGTALVSSGDTTGQLVFRTNGTTTALTLGTDQSATFAGNVVVSGSIAVPSPLAVTGNSTAGAEIRLPEDTDNGSNYVALKAPNSLASNLTFTLPTADGTNGQYLQTNGSGQLAFATVPTTSPAGSTGQIQINNAGSFGAVASGTAGQYLTSGGAGSPPTWTAAPSQALTLIASGTLSSPASQILVNNLVTTGYSAVIIELLQIKFVSSSNTYLQFVAPGGTTSSGFFYAGVAFTRSSPNGLNTNNINGSNDLLLTYMNNANGVISANVNVFSPNLSTTYRQFYVNSGGYDGVSGQNYWTGGYHNASSFGGFRIYGDGVNLDTGASYRVYGVI